LRTGAGHALPTKAAPGTAAGALKVNVAGVLALGRE